MKTKKPVKKSQVKKPVKKKVSKKKVIVKSNKYASDTLTFKDVTKFLTSKKNLNENFEENLEFAKKFYFDLLFSANKNLLHVDKMTDSNNLYKNISLILNGDKDNFFDFSTTFTLMFLNYYLENNQSIDVVIKDRIIELNEFIKIRIEEIEKQKNELFETDETFVNMEISKLKTEFAGYIERIFDEMHPKINNSNMYNGVGLTKDEDLINQVVKENEESMKIHSEIKKPELPVIKENPNAYISRIIEIPEKYKTKKYTASNPVI